MQFTADLVAGRASSYIEGPLLRASHLTYRYYLSGMLGGIVALLSCATEPCACPPSRSHLVVSGTVTQGSDEVAGATIRFQEDVDGPCDRSQDRVHDLESSFGAPAEATTDAAGAFSAHLYSYFTPFERCVIATIAAGTDTVTVKENAQFVHEREAPETVRITVPISPPEATSLPAPPGPARPAIHPPYQNRYAHPGAPYCCAAPGS